MAVRGLNMAHSVHSAVGCDAIYQRDSEWELPKATHEHFISLSRRPTDGSTGRELFGALVLVTPTPKASSAQRSFPTMKDSFTKISFALYNIRYRFTSCRLEARYVDEIPKTRIDYLLDKIISGLWSRIQIYMEISEMIKIKITLTTISIIYHEWAPTKPP